MCTHYYSTHTPNFILLSIEKSSWNVKSCVTLISFLWSIRENEVYNTNVGWGPHKSETRI